MVSSEKSIGGEAAQRGKIDALADGLSERSSPEGMTFAGYMAKRGLPVAAPVGRGAESTIQLMVTPAEARRLVPAEMGGGALPVGKTAPLKMSGTEILLGGNLDILSSRRADGQAIDPLGAIRRIAGDDGRLAGPVLIDREKLGLVAARQGNPASFGALVNQALDEALMHQQARSLALEFSKGRDDQSTQKSRPLLKAELADLFARGAEASSGSGNHWMEKNSLMAVLVTPKEAREVLQALAHGGAGATPVGDLSASARLLVSNAGVVPVRNKYGKPIALDDGLQAVAGREHLPSSAVYVALRDLMARVETHRDPSAFVKQVGKVVQESGQRLAERTTGLLAARAKLQAADAGRAPASRGIGIAD